MNRKENSPKISETNLSKPAPDRMARFVELYTEYYPRIHFYLLAIVPTSQDAEDVMQEVSLVLWKKFDTFELGTNFFAWACKIARLQALKQYQRDGRLAHPFETSVLDKLAKDAEDAAERPATRLEILEECLQGLSDMDQKLIRRRYEKSSSVNQLALEIGRTPNSLSKSLGRIRQALLECLERKLPMEWRT